MYLGVSEVFMIASGKMIYTAHIYSCLKTLARVSVCARLGKTLISMQKRAITRFPRNTASMDDVLYKKKKKAAKTDSG